MTGPKVLVVCPDWTTKPMTQEQAETWVSRVEALGAEKAAGCHHSHEIIPACLCGHAQTRHAADQGFCQLCKCGEFLP